MYISALALKNWKNFRSIDVPFQERAFIVGPNASGKSNFLDALRFLRDIAKIGGGLQYAVNSVRGGVSKIRCLSARGQSDIGISIQLADTETKKTLWHYNLSFNQSGGGVREFKAIIRREQVWNSENKLVINRTEQEDDSRLLQYTFLEQPTMNAAFREVADFFMDIKYLHVIPHLVRNAKQVIMPDDHADYLGKDIIQHINKLNKRTQQSYLNKIIHALKYAIPQFDTLTINPDTDGQPHLQTTYLHWRARGARQWEDQFSDGTLRLIGLLWALLDGTKPVLLEEPELSLHSAIVRKLPAIIAKLQKRKSGLRQVILSTHSCELLNNPGISGEETILLIPGKDGTAAKTVNSDKEIRTLLQNGMSVGDAVIPVSAPELVEQVSFLKELGFQP